MTAAGAEAVISEVNEFYAVGTRTQIRSGRRLRYGLLRRLRCGLRYRLLRGLRRVLSDGLLINGRAVCLYREILVVTQRSPAFRTIYKSVRVPRSEIKIIVCVSYQRSAVVAGLLISQSAVPKCSFKCHINASLLLVKTLFLFFRLIYP